MIRALIISTTNMKVLDRYHITNSILILEDQSDAVQKTYEDLKQLNLIDILAPVVIIDDKIEFIINATNSGKISSPRGREVLVVHDRSWGAVCGGTYMDMVRVSHIDERANKIFYKLYNNNLTSKVMSGYQNDSGDYIFRVHQDTKYGEPV